VSASPRLRLLVLQGLPRGSGSARVSATATSFGGAELVDPSPRAEGIIRSGNDSPTRGDSDVWVSIGNGVAVGCVGCDDGGGGGSITSIGGGGGSGDVGSGVCDGGAPALTSGGGGGLGNLRVIIPPDMPPLHSERRSAASAGTDAASGIEAVTTPRAVAGTTLSGGRLVCAVCDARVLPAKWLSHRASCYAGVVAADVSIAVHYSMVETGARLRRWASVDGGAAGGRRRSSAGGRTPMAALPAPSTLGALAGEVAAIATEAAELAAVLASLRAPGEMARSAAAARGGSMMSPPDAAPPTILEYTPAACDALAAHVDTAQRLVARARAVVRGLALAGSGSGSLAGSGSASGAASDDSGSDGSDSHLPGATPRHRASLTSIAHSLPTAPATPRDLLQLTRALRDGTRDKLEAYRRVVRNHAAASGGSDGGDGGGGGGGGGGIDDSDLTSMVGDLASGIAAGGFLQSWAGGVDNTGLYPTTPLLHGTMLTGSGAPQATAPLAEVTPASPSSGYASEMSGGGGSSGSASAAVGGGGGGGGGAASAALSGSRHRGGGGGGGVGGGGAGWRPGASLREDLQFVKLISSGGAGRVYLARSKSTPAVYAVKMLKKSDLEEKNLINRVALERQIMTALTAEGTKFIVRLLDAFRTTDFCALVMEFVPGGDLLSLLRGVGALDVDTARLYAAQLIIAITFIHTRGIVHRDLKPDNVLIGADGTLKLTDFGLSHVGAQRRMEVSASRHGSSWFVSHRSAAASGDYGVSMASELGSGGGGGGSSGVGSGGGGGGSASGGVTGVGGLGFGSSGSRLPGDSEERARAPYAAMVAMDGILPAAVSPVGTANYTAPEVILGLGHGTPADWWSFGCLLFHMLVGYPPFFNAAGDMDATLHDVIDCNIHWPVSSPLPEDARSLLTALLVVQPNRRLGARSGAPEFRAHPFFAGVDWAAVYATPSRFMPEPLHAEDTSYFDPPGPDVHEDLEVMQAQVDGPGGTLSPV